MLHVIFAYLNGFNLWFFMYIYIYIGKSSPSHETARIWDHPWLIWGSSPTCRWGRLPFRHSKGTLLLSLGGRFYSETIQDIQVKVELRIYVFQNYWDGKKDVVKWIGNGFIISSIYIYMFFAKVTDGWLITDWFLMNNMFVVGFSWLIFHYPARLACLMSRAHFFFPLIFGVYDSVLSFFKRRLNWTIACCVDMDAILRHFVILWISILSVSVEMKQFCNTPGAYSLGCPPSQ